MERFRQNLQFLLQQKSWSTTDLAQKLGLSPNVIAKWLSGEGSPNLDQLPLLAASLQLSIDKLLGADLPQRADASKIKILVLDVDGVLTDGGIYLTERGDEIKKFHARDGRGIMTAQKCGIEVAFLSGGVQTEAIRARAERLGVKRWYVGKTAKTIILEEWLAESGWTYDQVAYIGDDANDLAVIAKAGLTACPADAAPKNREAVDIILHLPGGQGCVREFIEEHLQIEVD